MRDALSSKLGKEIGIVGTYEALALPRATGLYRSLLLRDVRTEDGRFVDDHMWARVESWVQAPCDLTRGDAIHITGIVIKYRKSTISGMVKEFGVAVHSIDKRDCTTVKCNNKVNNIIS